jgi:hypothetical protein
MAGKFRGYTGATGLGPGLKLRLVRAYAEGRKVGKAGGADTDNPYDGKGNDAEKAWDYGFNNQTDSAYKFECAQ